MKSYSFLCAVDIALLESGTAPWQRSAAAAAVLRVDVGGAGDIEGLDVKEREGLRSVKTAQHDVRSVCEASAGAGHPLLQGAASVRAFSIDVLRAEESVEAHCPRVHCGVVARARQAHPMATRGAEVSFHTDAHSTGAPPPRDGHAQHPHINARLC